MPTKNHGRMAQDMKRELIAIIGEMKDPRVTGGLLTVTRLDVTPDLDQAKVYISVMGREGGPEPVVKALALDHMSLLMAPGESEKLTATGGAEESYQWITSDSGVLKVSDDGTVSALTEGSAVVTVTCGEESVACAITVQKKADTTTNTPDNGTTTNKPDTNKPDTNKPDTTNKPNNGNTNTSSSLKNLKIKTEYGIDLQPRDDGKYDITMQSSEKTCQLTLEGITGTPTWKSSDTNVVKVSSDGKLERVGKGEATVTITLGSATAEILVRVN